VQSTRLSSLIRGATGGGATGGGIGGAGGAGGGGGNVTPFGLVALGGLGGGGDGSLGLAELKAVCSLVGSGGVQHIQAQLVNFIAGNVSETDKRLRQYSSYHFINNDCVCLL
jgi:hypothetical protein